MSTINLHNLTLKRLLGLLAITLFTALLIITFIKNVAAAASQYTFSGAQPPCVVGGDGTCEATAFTVTAGTPPTVITFAFEDEESIVFQTGNPQFHDISRSTGSGSPGPQFDGGLSPATGTIKWGMDVDDHTQGTTLTVGFSNYISGFSLPLFDVDRNPPAFEDRIVVYGYRDGMLVTPTFTSGGGPLFHDIGTNMVTGTANVANADNPTAANATLNIQFNDIINRVVIRYEPGDSAQANPNPQAIAVGAPLSFTPVSVNAVDLQSVETQSVMPPLILWSLLLLSIALLCLSWYGYRRWWHGNVVRSA